MAICLRLVIMFLVCALGRALFGITTELLAQYIVHLQVPILWPFYVVLILNRDRYKTHTSSQLLVTFYEFAHMHSASCIFLFSTQTCRTLIAYKCPGLHFLLSVSMLLLLFDTSARLKPHLLNRTSFISQKRLIGTPCPKYQLPSQHFKSHLFSI